MAHNFWGMNRHAGALRSPCGLCLKIYRPKNLLSVLNIYNNFRFVLISKLVTATQKTWPTTSFEGKHIESMIVN